jgi:protein gp37
MGESTAIAWTHHTFNPWWGCTKVSEACRNCYAEAWAKRTGHAETWGASGRRRFFSDKHWAEPLKWNRKAEEAGERRRVFCASMADVFEGLGQEHPDFLEMHRARLRLWDLIGETPWLDWLLLTKRPESITAFSPWIHERFFLPNVWLGTTVEDQETAAERIPHLLAAPATVRFLSCEPLLEAVSLREQWLRGAFDRCPDEGRPTVPGDGDPCAGCPGYGDECGAIRGPRVDWVIVGGESGRGARDFDLPWARSIVAECHGAGVPVFVKQLGAWPIVRRGVEAFAAFTEEAKRAYPHPPDELLIRLKLKDRKGGDPSEWPEDLRVREVPTP